MPMSRWSPTNWKPRPQELDASPRLGGRRREGLAAARRIWIAGFRSCRSVAELLNYQLRLFRPDEVQLVGGSGPEDLDLGAFQRGDAVVVVGFAPYSTASVLSARAAHDAGATLVAIADTVDRADGGGRRSSAAVTKRRRRPGSFRA